MNRELVTRVVVIFLLFCSALLGLGVHSKPNLETWVERILKELNSYAALAPLEKVYVHTDKTIYVAGDTIWFKAYSVLGPKNARDTLSKIVHLELVTPSDSVLFHLNVPTEKGLGWGQIDLPDSLDEGIYKIRAYTSFMINFGDFGFFTSEVHIFGLNQDKARVNSNSFISQLVTGDTKLLHLKMTDELKQPLVRQAFKLRLLSNGKVFKSLSAETDDTGIYTYGNLERTQGKQILCELEWSYKNKLFFERLFIQRDMPPVHVTFYPEGGELVAGAINKIAFEATDIFGKPAQVSLAIREVGSHSIFTTAKNTTWGRGFFVLQPASGKRYEALVTSGERDTFSLALPKPIEEGIAMRVETKADKILISLGASPAWLASYSNKTKGLLVGHKMGNIMFAIAVSISDLQTDIIIPASKYNSSGVMQLLFVTEDMKPWAERSIYVYKPTPILHAKVRISGDDNMPRGKTYIDIALADSLGNSEGGDVSVSVSDIDFTTGAQPISISAYLDLAWALTTKEPGLQHFYDKATLQDFQEIDLLMLTHGWRRFTWRDVVEKKNKLYKYPIEQGLAVSGRITTASGKPYIGSKLLMTALDKSNNNTFSTTTDSLGRFSFNGLAFKDTFSVLIKPLKVKGLSLPTYFLDSTTAPAPKSQAKYFNERNYVSKSDSQYDERAREKFKMFKINQGEYLLSDVSIVAARARPQTRAEVFGKIYSNAISGTTIEVAKNWGNTPTPISTLLSNVSGVQVSQSSTGVTINIRGLNSINGSSTPLILFDNIPVDLTFLTGLSSVDVDHIDVLKGPDASVFGSRGSNGVISIYSRRGNSYTSSAFSSDGMYRMKLLGLHAAREFYMPIYGVSTKKSYGKDLRTTLFWTPNIIMKKGETTRLVFFQNDDAPQLRLTVQGISNSGRPIYFQKVFGE